MDVLSTLTDNQSPTDRATMVRLTARSLAVLFEKSDLTFRKGEIDVSGEDALRSKDVVKSTLALGQVSLNRALEAAQVLPGGIDIVTSPTIAVCVADFALEVASRFVSEPNVIDVDRLADEVLYMLETFEEEDPDEDLVNSMNSYGQMIFTRRRILDAAAAAHPEKTQEQS